MNNIQASNLRIRRLSAEACQYFAWTMWSDDSTADDYQYWLEEVGPWFWTDNEEKLWINWP